jgi:hypothetical protein
MRSLAEIVKANREAAKMGVNCAFKPVGTKGGEQLVMNGDGGTVLTPKRMHQLGLDKY